MKLSRDEMAYNLKIQPLPLINIDHSDFYEQFERCPKCGGASNLSTSFNHCDVLSEPYEEHYKRCKPCSISWTYKAYHKIEDDPAYQAHIKGKEIYNDIARPRIVTPNTEGGNAIAASIFIGVIAAALIIWLLQ